MPTAILGLTASYIIYNLQPGDSVRFCGSFAEDLASNYNVAPKDELIVVAPSEAAGKRNHEGLPIFGDSVSLIYLKNKRAGYYFACGPFYLMKIASSNSKTEEVKNAAVCPNCGAIGQWVACALKCPKCWKVFG